jgi:hypothetical protein
MLSSHLSIHSPLCRQLSTKMNHFVEVHSALLILPPEAKESYI